ncbi:MAG: hypothetical protein JJ969_12380 [Rhizobiaceae bacterium]|nr:hypothetical protein [Rhizobiaceae bacterium]
MKLNDMFPNTDSETVEYGNEIQERVSFPIRAEDGKEFLIDRLYRDALRQGVGATVDAEGHVALMLYAEADNPRLFPADPAERQHGPDKTFPLGRIIHDAGLGEQVERLSKVGDHSRNWTIANTRISAGKKDNRRTRADFLAFIHEKAGDAAAAETERLLCTADALVRPDLNKTTTVSVEHRDREQEAYR